MSLASMPPAVVESQWYAGAMTELRCEFCGKPGRDQDVDWRVYGIFVGARSGSVGVRAGGRLARVEGYHPSNTSPIPDHIEQWFSALIYYEGGPFALGLGFHHADQYVLPVKVRATLPSIAARVGDADALHAYLSFGDFGSYEESSGQYRMGIGLQWPRGWRFFGGLAGELTPANGFEGGLLVEVWPGVSLGARFGVSQPDPSAYRFGGVGLVWTGRSDGPLPLLHPPE